VPNASASDGSDANDTHGVMLMFSVRLGLLAALCGGTAPPAAAYKWPGDTAGRASAISAKVIGQHCAGLLSASDIGEVDAYPAKAASELAAKTGAQRISPVGLPLHELVMRRQAEAYAKKYADPWPATPIRPRRRRTRCAKFATPCGAASPCFPMTTILTASPISMRRSPPR